MAKPSKYTRYQYRKSPVSNTHAEIGRSSVSHTDESEAEWIGRMKGFGITDEQIEAFVLIRSLEAFVDYCREQQLDIAYIDGSRLDTNRA